MTLATETTAAKLADPVESIWSWRLQIVIQVLIVYSVVTTALETMPQLEKHQRFFAISEAIVVVIFTAEYLFWWSRAANPFTYPLQPLAIIDLLAILPFYLSPFLATSLSLTPLRSLRLFRIFRLLKLARYSRSMQILGEAIRRTGPELLVFLFLAGIIVIISAMGLYYAEHDAQPDVYTSIPDSIWWAIVTLTTVGYGDVYPTTGIGRLIASIVMLTGIGFIAVPTSLISSAMTELAYETRAARDAEKAARKARADELRAQRAAQKEQRRKRKKKNR